MSWNKVIEETKKEVSFRLGSYAHQKTSGRVVAIAMKILVNDDGTPLLWTIESTNIKANGTGAREVLKYLDIL